jgi:hypothetical protein
MGPLERISSGFLDDANKMDHRIKFTRLFANCSQGGGITIVDYRYRGIEPVFFYLPARSL